uniref:3'-5' exonuclease domain-containing protein n=1 Tax=Panagrolaimus sp. ES5 TaxID=591445 RepID=A0AC34GFQ1_9BILA
MQIADAGVDENKDDDNKKSNVVTVATEQPDVADAVAEDECIEIETCYLWEKPYQIITVMTPKACRIFVDEYLIKSKPRIVGIDVQHSEQKAVLLQLATRKWICLIDIKKLSPNQWKRIFTTLFAPNIILVGFAFRFDILVETFSFLLKLLHERQGKVLCLQKLSNELIKDTKCDTVFLKKPTIGC